jgi:hypothetical protein
MHSRYLDFGNDKDTSPQFHEVSCLATVIAAHHDTLSLPIQPQSYISPPNSTVTLYYNGKPLVKQITTTIWHTMYSASLQKTICKQEKWSVSLFQSVDWAAHESAMQRTWSCKRITYSKLSNKLMNTNTQNRKFYGKTDKFPCCHVSPETITHMLTCPAPEVATFRLQQQDILWNNLTLLNTPPQLLDALKLGITTPRGTSRDWTPPQLEGLSEDAFQHQTTLSWEAFHRGRISNKWQLAFSGDNGTSKQSLKWAGQVVEIILHCTQQLWIFRCGVVHGQTNEENRQKQRATLLPQVQAAYEEYKKDPFHVPSHWRKLFTKPIQTFLLSDRDTLACWLRSYSEAVQQQNLVEVTMKRQASSLFGKSLLTSPHPTSEVEEDTVSEDESSDSDDDNSMLA